MAQAQPLPPNALRVAAVWGTTVVALKTLSRGESFELGDGESCELPIPDGIEMSATPLKGGAGGWELDARGSVGGLLTLRGRGEDPVAIARAGAPVPVMPGDFGLIQYGQFAIFFQYTAQPIKMSSLKGPELLTVLAIFCSAILHLGLLGLVRTLMTPDQLAKPLELTNPEEYAARFGLKRAVLETPPPEPVTAVGQEKGGGSGVKDPGAQDKKAAGRRKEDQGRRGQVRHERQGRSHAAARRDQADDALRRPQRGPRGRHRQGDPEHAQVDQHGVGGALRAQLEHRRPRQRRAAPA